MKTIRTTKIMRVCAAFAAFPALVFALGEQITDTSEYVTYVKTGEGWQNGSFWSDGSAPGAGKKYLVQGGGQDYRTSNDFVLRAKDTGTFGGDSLTLDGGVVLMKGGDNWTVKTTWYLYSCRISNGNAPNVQNLESPDNLMRVYGTWDYPTMFTGSTDGGNRKFRIRCSLVGGSEAVVRVTRTTSDGGYTANGLVQCMFKYNNADYAGRFIVDCGNWKNPSEQYVADFGDYAIGATAGLGALGKPWFGDGYKLSITNAYVWLKHQQFTNGYHLAVSGDARLSFSGDTYTSLSGSGVKESAYFGNGGRIHGESGSVLHTYNSSGTGAIALGDVAIDGLSKFAISNSVVVLRHDYSNGSIPIDMPNLATLYSVIGTNAASYAKLGALALGATPSVTISILKESGATLAAGESRVLFTSPTLGVEGGVALGAFSCSDESVALSIGEAEGVPALIASAVRETVTLQADDNDENTSFASAGHWSDAGAPSSEKDYVVPEGRTLRVFSKTVADVGTFAGNSLAVQHNGKVVLKARATFPNLLLHGGALIHCGASGSAISGNAYVYDDPKGTYDQQYPTLFVGNSTTDSTTHTTMTNALTFAGTGTLCFRWELYGSGSGDYPTRLHHVVTGQSPDFTGKIQLARRCVSTDFVNELAMGGPAPAFVADRLKFFECSTLRVSASYTMGDMTRGITFGDGFSGDGYKGGIIEVLDGQTLTVSNIIAGTSQFYKIGAGALRLCCPSNTFSGVVRNAEGTLAIAHADTLRNATFEISNGVWRVETPAGMTVKNKAALTANLVEGRKMRIQASAFDAFPKGQQKVSAVLLNVKGAGASDADALIDLVSLETSGLGRGCTVELSAEEADGGLRIVATARRIGLMLIVR